MRLGGAELKHIHKSRGKASGAAGGFFPRYAPERGEKIANECVIFDFRARLFLIR